MKTFTFPHPDYVRATMTVAEVRARLAEFPDDLPVFAQWESCNGYVTPEMFVVEKVRKGRDSDFDALIIDVNDY